MSDLIFVCVSPDLDLADALADVFETAGHSIGDSEDEAHATIVILSHASRRSRAFLETAKRVAGAGKALVVSREGMESIEGAPIFNLASWDGDPDSELINPLFDAVDRKLIHARAGLAPEVQGASEVADAPPEFVPPRVRSDFSGWKRPQAGNGARALAFIAVLVVGALSASALLAHREPEAPAARLTVATEVSPDTFAVSPEAAAIRVAFTDAVSTDASLDNTTPPESPALGVRRGREPPSASSLPRRQRTPAPRASWRDASYQAPSEAGFQTAAYEPPPSTVAPPRPKHRDKEG